MIKTHEIVVAVWKETTSKNHSTEGGFFLSLVFLLLHVAFFIPVFIKLIGDYHD